MEEAGLDISEHGENAIELSEHGKQIIAIPVKAADNGYHVAPASQQTPPTYSNQAPVPPFDPRFMHPQA